MNDELYGSVVDFFFIQCVQISIVVQMGNFILRTVDVCATLDILAKSAKVSVL